MRLVADLVASMVTAHDIWVDSHFAFVMEMNVEESERRFNLYIDKIEDTVEAMKVPALVITQSADGEGVTITQADVRRLKQDYARMVFAMDFQMVGLKAAVVVDMTKDQGAVRYAPYKVQGYLHKPAGGIAR